MNKTQPFLLLAASLALLGCSQGGDDATSFAAPSGSEVGKEVVSAHYAKAAEAMSEAKAIGVKLAGSVSYASESSGNENSNGAVATYSASQAISYSDIDATIAMSLGDEAKASMKASASYSYGANAKGSIYSSASETSASGKASLAAYWAEGTLYGDLSGLADLLTGSASSSPASLKLKTTVDMPSVNWSACADYLDKLEEIASKSEYIKVNEGTYSFLFTINPSSSSFLPGYSSIDAGNGYEGELKAWLSFTEEGFTEAGVSGKVKYEYAYSYDASGSSYHFEAKGKLEEALNLKATFSYGDSVKIEEVSDPDSYVDVNAPSE